MDNNSSKTEAAQKIVASGLVRLKEAATFLGVSRSKLYELMDDGSLQFAKIGRSRRIPQQALVEFAARNLQGGLGG